MLDEWKNIRKKIFKNIFVAPASGDDGCAIGACYLAYKKTVNFLQRDFNFYLGSRFSKSYVKVLDKNKVKYTEPENLYKSTAKFIADGKIVAWFQGGAEFGPRALGNRSTFANLFQRA